MDESENFEELFKSSKKVEQGEAVTGSEEKELKNKKKTKKDSDADTEETTLNKDEEKVKKKKKADGAKKTKKTELIAEETVSQAKSTSKIKVATDEENAENPGKKKKKKADEVMKKTEISKAKPDSKGEAELGDEVADNEGKKKKKKKEKEPEVIVTNVITSKQIIKDNSQNLPKSSTPLPVAQQDFVESIMKSLSLQDDMEETIMRYMINMNRPYSIGDIFNNHHGKFKKKQLEQTLISLADRNLLIAKKYTTPVYLVSQNLFPPVSEVQLKALNKEVEEIEENIKNQKVNQQKLQQNLKQVKAVLSEEEISKKIVEKQEEKIELNKKLEIYRNQTFEKIPEEVIDKILSEYEQRFKKFKTIRKTMNNIIDTLSEGMEISTKEFYNKYNLDNIKETEEKLKIKAK